LTDYIFSKTKDYVLGVSPMKNRSRALTESAVAPV